MTLGQQQRKFTLMTAHLILFAYEQGYELTYGDASRMDNKGHVSGSFHYKRLAVDFNLFKDGVYLTTTEAHTVLGEFWKSIGGTWGGDFKHKDGNHYQFGGD